MSKVQPRPYMCGLCGEMTEEAVSTKAYERGVEFSYGPPDGWRKMNYSEFGRAKAKFDNREVPLLSNVICPECQEEKVVDG